MVVWLVGSGGGSLAVWLEEGGGSDQLNPGKCCDLFEIREMI